MTSRNFSLQPFPAGAASPVTQITGQMTRRGAALSLDYTLRGRLAAVLLPAKAAIPARRHRLWEETCFEFFLAVKEAPSYWEFNLSPAGFWNVYHFEAYRQGLAEATAFSSLPFEVRRRRDSLRLALEVDLAGMVQAEQTLEVAIAAVIKTVDGRVSYWALTHPGSRPDFHRRDSFILSF